MKGKINYSSHKTLQGLINEHRWLKKRSQDFVPHGASKVVNSGLQFANPPQQHLSAL